MPDRRPPHPSSAGRSTAAPSPSSSSSHLRQRSLTSSSSLSSSSLPPTSSQPPRRDSLARNPFHDPLHRPIGPPLVPVPMPPVQHRAALMQMGSHASLTVVDLGGDEGTMRDQAGLFRGDRAEWAATQQHLYSSPTPSLGPFLGSTSNSPSSSSLRSFGGLSLTSSSHSSPKPASSSSRYDVTSSDVLSDDDDTDALHDIRTMKLTSSGRERRISDVKPFGQGGMDCRGFFNLLAVSMLLLTLVGVFAGLPIWSYLKEINSKPYGSEGVTVSSELDGKARGIPAYRGLIDKDTPEGVKTMQSFLERGKELKLVFSDEFNEPGRQFEPGMDPYWEAVDLHYWGTNNLEWYDPHNAYTEDGFLVLEVTKEDLDVSHGFGYFGGMIASWNQACFQGGYVDVGVSLPGSTTVSGLWPAAWMMSNLGRAGYGGSLDGSWPYVYDNCDVGTLPNQTDPSTGLPTSRFRKDEGDQYNPNGDLSHLQGQRFSACTCPSETDHPGPLLPSGRYKGRGASEIDVFEATVEAELGTGSVSQSAQWAPFSPSYSILNATSDLVWFNSSARGTHRNAYVGGTTQQVTSGLSATDPLTYNSTTNFAKYGTEWIPTSRNGYGTGKMAWTMENALRWNISDRAMAANARAEIGNREVTDEAMYVILNVGMSPGFGFVDLDNLEFPARMRVDYVRVYQDPDHISVGCDPADAPTADYIEKNPELYYNANLTTYKDAGRTFAENSLIDTC